VSCSETAEPIDLPFNLGCGLGYAERSTSSIVFARWRQCVHMGGTLAPPSEYDYTVYLRRLCGLISNYFDH